MATKLKKPITITFTHVENAVAGAMLCSAVSAHPNFAALEYAREDGEMLDQLVSALKEQGIDWNTWKPEPPFTIGGRAVEFKDDGSARIGCTTVSAEEIDEFVKRRAVAHLPKYFKNNSNGFVYRQKSSNPTSRMDYFSASSRDWVGAGRFDDYPELELQPLTLAESIAIVGEENV